MDEIGAAVRQALAGLRSRVPALSRTRMPAHTRERLRALRAELRGLPDRAPGKVRDHWGSQPSRTRRDERRRALRSKLSKLPRPESSPRPPSRRKTYKAYTPPGMASLYRRGLAITRP